MASVQLLCTSLVVVLSLVCDPLSGESADYNLLVVLPEVDGTVVQQSWQNIEQLLLGVELAKQSIRELDLPFTLRVRDTRIDCSSLYSGYDLLVEFVREVTAFDSRTNVAVAIRLFCGKRSYELKGLINGERFGLVEIVLNSGLSLTKMQNFYHAFPSILAYAEALAQFMQHVGWTRIAVIYTEPLNSYYYENSQQLVGKLKDKGFGYTVHFCQVEQQSIVTIEVTGDTAGHIMTAIRSIHASGVKIIYVLLPPEETVLLLCHAYDYGLHWPEYGWVVPDVSLEDALQFKNVEGCGKNAMQGIFSFRIKMAANNTCYSKLFPQNSNVSSLFHSNMYAKALYDSILATAFSLNITQQRNLFEYHKQSLTHYNKLVALRVQSHLIGQALANVSFPGALGQISFNRQLITETQIATYQILDGMDHEVAVYNPHMNTTNFLNNVTSAIPSSNLTREYEILPTAAIAVLTAFVAFCVLLTTFNMILFLYYCKEPEIKASSVGLSMLIHISCYVLYIGCLYEIYRKFVKSQSTHCIVGLWTVLPWTDVILATLLVKICRIYHIFNYFGKIKNWSDIKLLIVIFLVLFGKVTILLAWNVHESLIITDVEIYQSEPRPPHCKVVQVCESEYCSIFFSISLGYTGILGGITVFLALKTRKIRRKDFKDTKKVNLTVVTWFVGVAMLVPIWLLCRRTSHWSHLTETDSCNMLSGVPVLSQDTTTSQEKSAQMHIQTAQQWKKSYPHENCHVQTAQQGKKRL